MAEEVKEIKKGVVIEFDFTAMDGAQLLFDVTKKFLSDLDAIPFDEIVEDRHLAGSNCQGGFAEYFPLVKTKKTAAKAAKDLLAAFAAALAGEVPKGVTPSFKNFVSALAAKGVKVVISTRANPDKVKAAFEGVLGDDVVLYQETSPTYGCVKWDGWRRACAANGLHNRATVAVTGSGFGVKSALLAGMGAFAVVHPHVAYQDFGGADDVVADLNAAAARTVLRMLRI